MPSTIECLRQVFLNPFNYSRLKCSTEGSSDFDRKHQHHPLIFSAINLQCDTIHNVENMSEEKANTTTTQAIEDRSVVQADFQPTVQACAPIVHSHRFYGGGDGGLVEVVASLRWWNIQGMHYHVKGKVGVEQFGSFPLFHLVCLGRHMGSDGMSGPELRGTLYFPFGVALQTSGTHSDLSGTHTTAQGVVVEFPENVDGLTRLQIIMPTTTRESQIQAMVFSQYVINNVALSS